MICTGMTTGTAGITFLVRTLDLGLDLSCCTKTGRSGPTSSESPPYPRTRPLIFLHVLPSLITKEEANHPAKLSAEGVLSSESWRETYLDAWAAVLDQLDQLHPCGRSAMATLSRARRVKTSPAYQLDCWTYHVLLCNTWTAQSFKFTKRTAHRSTVQA